MYMPISEKKTVSLCMYFHLFPSLRCTFFLSFVIRWVWAAINALLFSDGTPPRNCHTEGMTYCMPLGTERKFIVGTCIFNTAFYIAFTTHTSEGKKILVHFIVGLVCYCYVCVFFSKKDREETNWNIVSLQKSLYEESSHTVELCK